MRRGLWASAAVLVTLTLVYTWPLTRLAGHAVAHDSGDPLLVT